MESWIIILIIAVLIFFCLPFFLSSSATYSATNEINSSVDEFNGWVGSSGASS